MYNITEDDIDFMLEDMKSKGVILEDLLDNLLDHLCCIIETEMKDEEDFRSFYEGILPRFFNQDLSEIQKETTNLLRFKNFYSMKRTLKISGIATVVFTLLGAILKTAHLPGAGITIVLGGFFFSFVFLPLLIMLKFKDEDSKTDKAVFSFGFVISIILSVGLIFKLMHWPGANKLMIGSTVVFTFIYVPLYFFTRYRRPEIRFNTIVNTVLMFACGGIFYSLFDLSFSRKYSEQIIENHFFLHENSLQLMTSNDRLYEIENQSDMIQNIHQISKVLNEQLESIASEIVASKTAKNVARESKVLQDMIIKYNEMIMASKLEGLQRLDEQGAVVLERLSPELAMNTLARIQQQIAVNENSILTIELLNS